MRAAVVSAVLLSAAVTPLLGQTEWQLGERPLFSIGVTDGAPEYTLSNVRGALRLPDGRVVIINENELRYYDAQGKHLLTTGGRGSGPGEFQFLAQLLPGPADTVLAWDARLRLSRFDGEGRFVTSTTVDRTRMSVEGMYSEGNTLLPDGSLLLPMHKAERPGDPLPKGMFRPEIRYARFDPKTGRTTFIGSKVYGGLRQQFMHTGGRPSPMVQPFTPHAYVAASGAHIYITNSEELLIDVHDYTGRLITEIRSDREPVQVTRAMLDEYRDRTIASMKERGQAERVPEFERGWSSIEHPKTMPAFRSLRTDRSGAVWAGLGEASSALSPSMTYLVFDPAGREVGTVRMPARFQPLDIGYDYVLGRYMDEMDVQYVQLYTLTRR